MSHEERFWPARMRWRLRGAWMWPSFVAVTLIDGILLHKLPPIGTGVDLIPAILLATFGNLILVGAVGPWLARRMWKRRPAADPGAPAKAQLEVLSDRIGTGLLVASIFGVLAAGLAARPTVIAETDAKGGGRTGPACLRPAQRRPGADRNEETANAARLAEGYFRICIARDDRERFACFFLDTNKQPTEIVRDPSAKPNRLEP